MPRRQPRKIGSSRPADWSATGSCSFHRPWLMQGRWPLLKPRSYAALAIGKRTAGWIDAAWDSSLLCVIGTDWLCHGLGGSPSHADGWRGRFHAAWVVVELPEEGMLATRRREACARVGANRIPGKLPVFPRAARIVTTVTLMCAGMSNGRSMQRAPGIMPVRVFVPTGLVAAFCMPPVSRSSDDCSVVVATKQM